MYICICVCVSDVSPHRAAPAERDPKAPPGRPPHRRPVRRSRSTPKPDVPYRKREAVTPTRGPEAVPGPGRIWGEAFFFQNLVMKSTTQMCLIFVY